MSLSSGFTFDHLVLDCWNVILHPKKNTYYGVTQCVDFFHHSLYLTLSCIWDVHIDLPLFRPCPNTVSVAKSASNSVCAVCSEISSLWTSIHTTPLSLDLLQAASLFSGQKRKEAPGCESGSGSVLRVIGPRVAIPLHTNTSVPRQHRRSWRQRCF